MKIVYVGPLWSGGTCLMRMRALQSLGHDVIGINTEPQTPTSPISDISARIMRRLGRPLDRFGLNDQIVSTVLEQRPAIVWIDKGLSVRPETLSTIRRSEAMISIVGYSPDDMYGTHNQSAYFLRGLPLYDTFITTKSFNVDELRRLGARNVLFIGNGFDPDTHKPMHVTPEDRCTFGGAVGFIGAWEKERGSQMLSLAKAGVGVRVWGWQPPKGLFQVKHANLVVEGRPLWGSDYVKAICGFDINLGFLRKQNRDLETTRSIEIPACGAFMLAERTKEHLILFEEGKEAEFFGSTEELISKCKFYLVHEEIRKKIAAAGRIRCLKSGYSNRDRIDAILRQIK